MSRRLRFFCMHNSPSLPHGRERVWASSSSLSIRVGPPSPSADAHSSLSPPLLFPFLPLRQHFMLMSHSFVLLLALWRVISAPPSSELLSYKRLGKRRGAGEEGKRPHLWLHGRGGEGGTTRTKTFSHASTFLAFSATADAHL